MFIKGHIGGIYKITCLKNNKFYIGSSTNIIIRWKLHKSALKRNAHPNTYLQNSWNKYGENNFKFEIMENVKTNLLIERELSWFKRTKCFDHKYGFNIINPGTFPMLGRKHSEKSKSKISIAMSGRILTDSHKRNIGLSRDGNKHTKESKLKMSITHQGSKNHFAKLTDLNIQEIRAMYKNGFSVKEIANIYNVHSNTIYDIINNKSWKHIQ
jgi:group I intron endonuclease